MIDPIGAYARVASSVISYIQTAFGTRFVSLEEERERLLSQPGSISQELWIEPLPRYESSGKSIADLTAADLPGMPAAAVADFTSLAASGLVGQFPLHRHQVEMLNKALQGMSCVITAGTGSGKTESFLLPLFAYLAASQHRGRNRARHPHISMTGGRATNGAITAILWWAGSADGGNHCVSRNANMNSDRPRCARSWSTR